MKNKRGFTLIELLIAASIFTVVLGSIYTAFNTGILSYRKIDSSFEVYQTSRIILNRLELDLKNAFAYKKENSGFKGAASGLDFFSVINRYDNNADAFLGISRIVYTLEGNSLKRTEYAGFDAPQQVAIEGQELCSSVKELSFEYASISDEGEAYAWFKTWPKDEQAQGLLPLAVKVKLVLATRTNKQLNTEGAVEFTTVIPLGPGGGAGG